jgi:hypothetical protein
MTHTEKNTPQFNTPIVYNSDISPIYNKKCSIIILFIIFIIAIIFLLNYYNIKN